ncbi:hypothetical protein PsYK624_110330 [Phanerochaete sordida]|uniref:Uncharacterized protein n=1 Tax=Phanerochaete sordida TaxID=48140 RepID=A0A9P3LI66_9APHY|nr:hypothetical protein PsYK624_110330 [Phanerochaete sordida]
MPHTMTSFIMHHIPAFIVDPHVESATVARAPFLDGVHYDGLPLPQARSQPQPELVDHHGSLTNLRQRPLPHRFHLWKPSVSDNYPSDRPAPVPAFAFLVRKQTSHPVALLQGRVHTDPHRCRHRRTPRYYRLFPICRSCDIPIRREGRSSPLRRPGARRAVWNVQSNEGTDFQESFQAALDARAAGPTLAGPEILHCRSRRSCKKYLDAAAP